MKFKNAVLDDLELQAGLKKINPKFGDFCTRVTGEAWGLPLIDHETSSLRGDREKGLWILDLVSTARGERQRLWVHPQSFRILRAESHRSGSSRCLIFSDFSQLQGMSFPKRIQLTSSQPKGQISVEYQEVELNPGWKNEDFQLPVPRGAKVVPLE